MADEVLFDPDDYVYCARSTATRQPAPTNTSVKLQLLEELQDTLNIWNNLHSQPAFDPIPTLEKMATMLEDAIDDFLKQDPDPLDDRHPNRTHPQSAFGTLLKVLFRNDIFMNKLIISYLLGRDQPELSVAAARLLLNCVPGLDSAVIFSEPEDFVPQLYHWAAHSDNEMLQAYSMGLLSAAVEVQDNASKHRALNAQLIPVALRRLNTLRERLEQERSQASIGPPADKQIGSPPGPFANMKMDDEPLCRSNSAELPENSRKLTAILPKRSDSVNSYRNVFGDSFQPMRIRPTASTTESISSPPRKKKKNSPVNLPPNNSFGSLQDLENSSSRWDLVQPYVIGNHKVFPLTTEMHLRLILQFLAPTGEYQDLLSLAYEGQALDQILYYIDLQTTKDVRLTFDALRYLTSLLVHRKFALEFVARGGVLALLKVPRACMASVGVSTCMYYLSYNEDVMEKVCQLGDKILDNIVEYCLWCLEHSYESGMASASMFFTHGFFYKAILERFDEKNGLRVLYNYLSTLSLLHDVANAENFELSEEQMHTSTQSVRNASAAFRSYVGAHLYVKLEQIRRAIGNKSVVAGCIWPSSIQGNLPPYKTMELIDEPMEQAVNVLTNLIRFSSLNWRAIEEARKMGLIRAMLSIIIGAQDWSQTAGRCEMARNALEVLWVCSALPKVQTDFCEEFAVATNQMEGFTILVDVADGTVFEDEADIQIAALLVIINCCASSDPTGKLSSRGEGGRKSRMSSVGILQQGVKESLDKVYTCLRQNNILMVLNNIIRKRTPVSEADRLRATACKALLGLARSQEIRQILTKLPLIASNELQSLMKEPVAQDKKTFHNMFCKCSKELFEVVTERPVSSPMPNPKDLTQEQLWKARIVSKTKITYNEKELLQLIHEHLLKKGLTETATHLMKEAELPDVPASLLSSTPSRLQPLPQSLTWQSPPRAKRTLLLDSGTSPAITAQPSTSQTSSMSEVEFATPSRVRRHKHGYFPRRLTLRPSVSMRNCHHSDNSLKPLKGLDHIITDYFRTQHSMCKNPVTTCPPFSLYYPHQCPEPRTVGEISQNIVQRFLNRPVIKSQLLPYSRLQDERLVFSKFRPSRTICEHEEMYTSCAFSIDDEHLIVGMFTGDVHWINMESGVEESQTSCHSSGITSIVPSKDGTMLLTSSAYIHPLSSMWRLGEAQEHLYDFNDEYFVQFSNCSQDKIVGTNGEHATVYDTESGRMLIRFSRKGLGARYQHNKASFSPCDELVLNDGILWDVRCPDQFVHSFDKMNPTNSGVFHPHGREIILNSEVWDVRTFRLLHTVPALDQCKIIFNSTGNILYATTHTESSEPDNSIRHLGSSFRTLDSRDYSGLTTVDSKRALLDICCDHSDRYVAVVEKLRSGPNEFLLHHEESLVRTYEVGKHRDAEDDADEDEEDDNEDGGSADLESDSDSMTDVDDGSSDLIGSEDVFDAIGRLEAGSSSSSSDSYRSDDSDSGSWETASNQDIDNMNEQLLGSEGEANAEGNANAANQDEEEDDENDSDDDDSNDNDDDDNDNDDDDDDDDDGDDLEEMDITYRPDSEDAHPSSSTTALNPHLRKQRRRRSES